MARRENPEINAGSMADIAFLLLIFFLVTTTMNVDSGVSKKLSEKPPADYVPPVIKEKNIFEVNINRNNELLVEGERMDVKDIKEAAIKFIDNGGGLGKPGEDGSPGEPCDYCEGDRSDSSSDHPNKAIISVQSDRGTEYGTYIKVQNELLRAYTVLRNRLCTKRYKMSFDELEETYKDNKSNEDLKKKVEDIKKSYPQIISDAEPTS
ncbi:Biopolymer transport protein ExbD [Polaribacter sp. Hel1_33_78]|jgi:biopolymer transport protein ExbD|uniref:ExbD/TolR family protein n=1 Tax=unclassified Polaribacter TaxID=196858 RepID=UPI00052D40B0|nr:MULTISPECIES: biopolymer transporter ExbD [unclassified Polaribacter]MDG2275541.1 biopolymer transporter ExbD [Flavobacteriaceae bacterium]KGL59404.1 biopolymer transport ExbD/TolR protein [Polaribacter sp. Hel1_33_49]MBT3740657.1 biopolymer transporter ExbD [Polaribacter sp.]MBT4414406.1 biopolymer transporter ExbD [Polaribacter sp.]MBT7815197.1 biopolymer transporter ExbD [Polaribacter sp.]